MTVPRVLVALLLVAIGISIQGCGTGTAPRRPRPAKPAEDDDEPQPSPSPSPKPSPKPSPSPNPKPSPSPKPTPPVDPKALFDESGPDYLRYAKDGTRVTKGEFKSIDEWKAAPKEIRLLQGECKDPKCTPSDGKAYNVYGFRKMMEEKGISEPDAAKAWRAMLPATPMKNFKGIGSQSTKDQEYHVALDLAIQQWGDKWVEEWAKGEDVPCQECCVQIKQTKDVKFYQRHCRQREPHCRWMYSQSPGTPCQPIIDKADMFGKKKYYPTDFELLDRPGFEAKDPTTWKERWDAAPEERRLLDGQAKAMSMFGFQKEFGAAWMGLWSVSQTVTQRAVTTEKDAKVLTMQGFKDLYKEKWAQHWPTSKEGKRMKPCEECCASATKEAACNDLARCYWKAAESKCTLMDKSENKDTKPELRATMPEEQRYGLKPADTVAKTPAKFAPFKKDMFAKWNKNTNLFDWQIAPQEVKVDGDGNGYTLAQWKEKFGLDFKGWNVASKGTPMAEFTEKDLPKIPNLDPKTQAVWSLTDFQKKVQADWLYWWGKKKTSKPCDACCKGLGKEDCEVRGKKCEVSKKDQKCYPKGKAPQAIAFV